MSLKEWRNKWEPRANLFCSYVTVVFGILICLLALYVSYNFIESGDIADDDISDINKIFGMIIVVGLFLIGVIMMFGGLIYGEVVETRMDVNKLLKKNKLPDVSGGYKPKND